MGGRKGERRRLEREELAGSPEDKQDERQGNTQGLIGREGSRARFLL
jgi:hypothetical protein